MEILRKIPHSHYLWTRDQLLAFRFGVARMNQAEGKVTPLENRRMEKNLLNTASRNNLSLIGHAPPNSSVFVTPFPAKGTKRFLLVDRCPRFHSPHLH
jgi:hypothetical protein